MASDARYRTKVYLDTYLDSSNITHDDDSTAATILVAFGFPDYPLIRVFDPDEKDVDVVFSIEEPNSTPLMGHDQTPYGYEEHVPITICCVDKPGVTGTKIKWKAEAELRRVLETYPLGSMRILENRSDTTQRIGGTTIYMTTWVLTYKRSTTV
mgnify:CR=1 FL=1